MSVLLVIATLAPMASATQLPSPRKEEKGYSVESSKSISKKKWKVLRADPPRDLPRYQLSPSFIALKKMDKNNDGLVDKNEIRNDFRLKYTGTMPAYYLSAKERQTVSNFMVFYDKDKSGTISEEEMKLGEEKLQAIKNPEIKADKARKS